MSKRGGSKAYSEVARSASAKLPKGDQRLAPAPSDLRRCFWPTQITLENEIVSNYGTDSQHAELQTDFADEVEAIRLALREHWEESSPNDPTPDPEDSKERLLRGIDEKAAALSVWDQIGLPLRRKGDMLYHLTAPRDVMGKAIIRQMAVDEFLNFVAYETAETRIEIERLTRHLAAWRLAAIVAVVAVAFLMWQVVS